uniref:elongator complex protein 2 n=1 Tax=Ciona intestinalis TaxID=7719 RepID=UPI000180C419|nr:elongator complex protein 2 [Ciona intestinalis]|eukprot:XP_002128650.1 elongator complex protein 2 [Ciona intestinalis]
MKCNVNLEHVALCCNKNPHCLDHGPDDVIAFGSSNSVVIYEPVKYKDGIPVTAHVVSTLNHHRGPVGCVKWIRRFSDDGILKTPFLLSGSVDKTITCWKIGIENGKFDKSEEILAELKGHSGTITAMDGIVVGNRNLISSAGADSCVKIWFHSDNITMVDCVQTIDFNNGFVHGLSMHMIPNTKVPMLALACDDFKIHIYNLNGDILELEKVEFKLTVCLSGHEDWVRDVDFLSSSGDLILSSCSQDGFVRLWKIQKQKEIEKNDFSELKMKQQNFEVCGVKYSVCIEAVLSGHENWVYSVQWVHGTQPMLLSASIDKTVVVWEYDVDCGMWIDKVRVGEVGGNTLGFYGAQCNDKGNQIVAHSHSGALHAWDLKGNGEWKPAVVVTGHSAPVLDISWEPLHGRYLLTTGDDQTTRVLSQWVRECGFKSWHEIARPQIHGYDITCLSMMHSLKFVSGADEKVLRVFEAPKNYLENLKSLTGFELIKTDMNHPEGATVPALGLSNKAVLAGSKCEKESDRSEQYIENMFIPAVLDRPPPETHLLQNTLWPEVRKLYGHVYEIFCVACSKDGNLIASAAKSSKPQHAGIIIWDTNIMQQVDTLHGHTLTVTQMEFSPNGNYLLSVSRDRTWIIHKINKVNSTYEFSIHSKSEKKASHSRIIWSCSWAHDSKLFVTGSRDKKLMIWEVINDTVNRLCVEDCGQPITAVAFSSKLVSMNYIIAYGLENGRINISLFSTSGSLFQTISMFNLNFSHCLAVKRLQWKPNVEENSNLVLASCSLDNQVKMFEVLLES